MLNQSDIDQLGGRNVYASDGDKIGTVNQIYADDETGQPNWVTVRTGLFGTKETFVPLDTAALTTDGLTVAFAKAFVKDAPNVDEDGHLSHAQEGELYAYYNLEDTTPDASNRRAVDETVSANTGTVDQAATTATEGHDTSGPTTDDAMTVSEERLSVGTEQHEAGRARLRKYVVTENVTQTVPVQREEVRLEREPITEGNVDASLSGPSISEEEHEVVLHEERVVVQKETVPVERVRLGTETVTEQETVSDEVRKEHVELEGDTAATNHA